MFYFSNMKKWMLFALAMVFLLSSHAQHDTSQTVVLADTTGFERVETDASFPGGLKAWSEFLGNNLRVAEVAKKAAPKNAKHWSQTAMVKFMVDRDGQVTDVTVVNSKELHKEVVKECLRVFALSPKWIPSRQNSKNVRSYHTQPVVFVLE